jgi:hypothetical protein
MLEFAGKIVFRFDNANSVMLQKRALLPGLLSLFFIGYNQVPYSAVYG